MAPEAADPDLWIDWIEGGKSPLADLRTRQFDDRKENSGRKIGDARNAVERAREVTTDARERFTRARAEVAQAELALRRAEEAEKRALDIARGVAAWAYLNEVAHVASTVFAMGPAWSLMRIVSGHLQGVEDLENSLSEDDRVSIAKYRETRKPRSEEMLKILHTRCGDPVFETIVFESFYNTLKMEEKVFSDKARVSRRTMKSGAGKNAKTDDAHHVASEVKVAP
jgi:hypothetical protein